MVSTINVCDVCCENVLLYLSESFLFLKTSEVAVGIIALYTALNLFTAKVGAYFFWAVFVDKISCFSLTLAAGALGLSARIARCCSISSCA